MTDEDVVTENKEIEKSKEELMLDKFNEALPDTFALTLPYEGFRCRAYRGRKEKFFTIACGNLRHPVDSRFKGRKVHKGDRIPNTMETRMTYFKSAYNELFPYVAEQLDMEKMNHDQMVGVCDMLYNRGPACLTRDDCALSDTLNNYLSEPSVENGILPSLYMTAKRDDEKGMSGLPKRRNHERKLIFGDDADQIIEATKAIKTVKWKDLPRKDLKALASLVAECGPDCLIAENAELPKVISKYVKNPTADNQKLFEEEVQRARDIKYIQRPAKEDIKTEVPDFKDLVDLPTVIHIQEANEAMKEAIKRNNEQTKEANKKIDKDQELDDKKTEIADKVKQNSQAGKKNKLDVDLKNPIIRKPVKTR